jgi:4-amino-4-deoxy-L-arabinose transferase-like glycosyltransferase
MRAYALPILAALVVLLAVAGVARYLCASARQRNALSVLLVVLGLLTAFFFFFVAGSWLGGSRSQPRPHARVPVEWVLWWRAGLECPT